MIEAFRALHRGPGLFKLVNCWDAGSACVLEHAGAPAIATTSAGLAWSHGHRDGQSLPRETLVAAVRTIARVISVPLTVDVEAGYSDDPDAVAELMAALADAGAVGINLEDSADSPGLLATKIERVKARAELFVNARTDVYLRGLVPEAERVGETQARARRYRDAGADALFVPKVVARDDIRAIGTGLPLNVLAWPGLPPLAELPALGVRRVSTGSALAQVALGHAARAARAFLNEGELLTDGALSFAELNPLFR